MSHQPYETYLFSEADINAEQQQQLDLHLRQCDHCSTLAAALADLDKAFNNSPTPEPAPGFTERWHILLSEHRQKRQSRSLWLMTIGLFTCAVLILTFILIYHLQHINWAYELSQFVARLSLFTAEIRFSIYFFRSLSNILPFIIPIMLVFGTGTLFAVTALILFWFRTIIRLYSPIQERGNLS